MMIRTVLLSAALLGPTLAAAADKPALHPGWNGKGQAGFVFSQGNSEAKSANAALDLTRIDERWTHDAHLGGLYGESAGITSAQKWDAGWQTRYDLNPDFYVFGTARYARDQFSGFRYQATVASGLGYRFINTETVKLSGQLGAGYRTSKPELIVKSPEGEVISRTPLDTTSDAVGVAGLDYSHALTASTSLSNKLLVEYGSSNTLVSDTFALVVSMSERLALSVGVIVQNNSNPPAGLEKRDTVETANIVFSF